MPSNAVKLDGLTSEKKWNRVYYGFDEEGRLKVHAFLGIKELSDNDLLGVGVEAIRDSTDQLISQNSWVIRMPGDGCFLKDCEGLESFLTGTNDDVFESEENKFIAFPNPARRMINIKFIEDINYTTIRYKLHSTDGSLVTCA